MHGGNTHGGASIMDVTNLHPADLIFVRGTRWLDFPVKLVTQSQYTHVAGYVGDGLLIEAQGLRSTGHAPLSQYEDAADVFRVQRLTRDQTLRIVAHVTKEIGGEYDYLLLGWEAVRLVFGILLPYVRNKRRICSTLWADAYKSAGVNLCPDVSYPTPSDLVRSPHLRKIGALVQAKRIIH